MNKVKDIQTKKRVFTKLGYSQLETVEIMTALNNLLANYSVHYQKLRGFHWNVKGSDFFDLHEQFEIQYNEAKLAIDDIAERIRVFGQTPFSTMKEYLEHAIIPESSPDIPAKEMVQAIIDDYEVLLEAMFEVVDIATEHGDNGTEKMVKAFIQSMEKRHWMMSAFMQD
jgi:starvation-inducible DNA-binding protein